MRVLPVFALVLLSGVATAMSACGSTSEESQATPAAPTTTNPEQTEPEEGGTEITETPNAYPAPHSELPQVANLGGPVLAKPHFVPVFFQGASYRAQVIEYAAKIGKSAFWKATTEEYGVGPADALTPIDVEEPAPATITDDEIQDWLKTRFDGTHPEWGTEPIEGAIYTLFYPQATTIYLGNPPTPTDGGAPEGGRPDGGVRQPRAQSSCRSFGGYHADVRIKSKSVAYAVLPQCARFGAMSGIDALTGTTSHEWIEAATDPFPLSAPAYSMVDDAHLSWVYALGAGETADMCAQYDSSFYKDSEVGFVVQRSWSNAAAKAGKDPCQPTDPKGAPYFFASPRFKEDVALTVGLTKGVIIPVGQTKTVEVDLFSSGPTTGPWTVAAGATRGGGSPALTFELDKNTGVNGDKIHVKITSTAAASSRLGATPFIITSTLGNEKHYWAGVVGNE